MELFFDFKNGSIFLTISSPVPSPVYEFDYGRRSRKNLGREFHLSRLTKYKSLNFRMRRITAGNITNSSPTSRSRWKFFTRSEEAILTDRF
ncbi:hypothetical protein LEP1GSC047_1013 [Leptospira inadai serovar Lyme str. 10]|uniref:Uncharacterized protein n=2 Tax=Leptospira inadai serovar Lyme TaxID=293084 RepID=V6H8I9_9LEPT|nr:hypothetical protein LEP1GSC047_1013 [Leptospira inadai serovar Lyme str. 10]PNV74163.1 hypothetical protein BES34_015035 [Leptospira inadai serovar Lyme]